MLTQGKNAVYYIIKTLHSQIMTLNDVLGVSHYTKFFMIVEYSFRTW